MSKIVTREKFKCPITGKIYNKQEGYFYKSKSELFIYNNGFIPFSKVALTDVFNRYREMYNDTAFAIKRICIMTDSYYNKDLANSVAEMSSPSIGEYFKKINMAQYRGKTYDDSLEEEMLEKKKKDIIDNFNRQKEEDKEIRDSDVEADVIKFFGSGYTKEDYDFLVENFNEWKKRIGENLTKSEEGLLRNIVFNELDMMKARQNGESTKDLETTYLNNLKAGGWSPNQNTEDTTGLDCFGQFIDRIEDNDPIPDPDPEWEDVDGIKDYIDAFYKIPTAESIGLKTFEKSDAYNRLMKKYSITLKENDDEEENDELFDKALGVVNEE